MNIQVERLNAQVAQEQAGLRLDQALTKLFPDYSRSRLQYWVKEGLVTVDGRACRSKNKVYGGEQIEIQARMEQQVECNPQPIPLDLLFEDEHLLVINKPAGLVVHPAAGNPDGTMQNALLHYDANLIRLPRAGIVHRLDKDTSGLLVVARTMVAHKGLVEQLQAREMKREYRAVVRGVLVAGGTVDAPVGRHPVHRIRQAVVPNGKPAVTHYRVLERFRHHSYLQVNLETGRTHQIRVHMTKICHPLVGDPVYGGRLQMPAGATPAVQDVLRRFKRQALHARRLGLVHPASGEWLEWEAAVPGDMVELLEVLRAG
ncbi:Ribosomal large subunit pseudouridine synthase D [hydrothermal vent metagenome]|uniref:Ribosomal large subunit pseudouridine synthase D n=1 Tax=hydrothermal vent metagenome TaxID=652676 RepID=A0A3B1AHI7_9ZZZZ